MKQRLGSGVAALVAVNDGRASVAVGVTDDLAGQVSAVDLVKAAVAALGGQGGGGRPDMAQGGGPDGRRPRKRSTRSGTRWRRSPRDRRARRASQSRSGGSCHCGAVNSLPTLPQGLRFGAPVHLLDLPDARRGRGDRQLLTASRSRQGEDKLATYRFNTDVAEHHFCTRLRHLHAPQAALEPERARASMLPAWKACRRSISREVVVYDGQRHPADNSAQTTYTSGILTFTPTEN